MNIKNCFYTMAFFLLLTLISGCNTVIDTNSQPSENESNQELSFEGNIESNGEAETEEAEPRSDLKIKVDKIEVIQGYIGTDTLPGRQWFPSLYIGATRDNIETKFDMKTWPYPNAFPDCLQALAFVDQLNIVDRKLRDATVDTTQGEGFYINTDRKAGNDFLALCGKQLTLREIYNWNESEYLKEEPPYNSRWQYKNELERLNKAFPSWLNTVNTNELDFTLDLEDVVQEDAMQRYTNVYPWAMQIQDDELQSLPGRPRRLSPQVVNDLTNIQWMTIATPVRTETGHPPLHQEMPADEYFDNEADMVIYCGVDWDDVVVPYTGVALPHYSAVIPPYLYDTLLLFKDGTAYYMKYIDSYYTNWFVMQKDANGEYKLQEIWMQSMFEYESELNQEQLSMYGRHPKEYDKQKALRIANIPPEEKP